MNHHLHCRVQPIEMIDMPHRAPLWIAAVTCLLGGLTAGWWWAGGPGWLASAKPDTPALTCCGHCCGESVAADASDEDSADETTRDQPVAHVGHPNEPHVDAPMVDDRFGCGCPLCEWDPNILPVVGAPRSRAPVANTVAIAPEPIVMPSLPRAPRALLPQVSSRGPPDGWLRDCQTIRLLL